MPFAGCAAGAPGDELRSSTSTVARSTWGAISRNCAEACRPRDGQFRQSRRRAPSRRPRRDVCGRESRCRACRRPRCSSAARRWDFGPLEEIVEAGSLIGYPALVDTGQAVNVELFDEPQAAAASHAEGLVRLLRLALADQIRFLEKNLNARAIGLMFAPFGGERDLVSQLIEAGLRRACRRRTAAAATTGGVWRAAPGRRGRTPVADRPGDHRARRASLEMASAAQKRLPARAPSALLRSTTSTPDRAPAAEELHRRAALGQLAHRRVTTTAIAVRVDKLRADPSRDAP